MSNNKVRLWTFRIEHMIEACEDIIAFTKDMDAEDFQKDKKTYRSVERCFQILGEAAKHVPEEQTAQTPDVPWRKIKGMRNIVTHEYDNIVDDVLWSTIKNDIPDLLENLRNVKTAIGKE